MHKNNLKHKKRTYKKYVKKGGWKMSNRSRSRAKSMKAKKSIYTTGEQVSV